jgi:hypothetical protein
MKYDPLENHLKAQTGESLQLSFAEIEAILDSRLPASARKFPAWWSNNSTNHVNAQAWLEAGFRTEQVDLAEETVVFRRAAELAPSPPRTGRHPAWGALKGTVTVAPGVDLTEPLLEPWGGEEW